MLLLTYIYLSANFKNINYLKTWGIFLKLNLNKIVLVLQVVRFTAYLEAIPLVQILNAVE